MASSGKFRYRCLNDIHSCWMKMSKNTLGNDLWYQQVFKDFDHEKLLETEVNINKHQKQLRLQTPNTTLTKRNVNESIRSKKRTSTKVDVRSMIKSLKESLKPEFVSEIDGVCVKYLNGVCDRQQQSHCSSGGRVRLYLFMWYKTYSEECNKVLKSPK